ncbi:MAG: DUF5671 domain-containing protein [Anaerolineales bacterium]|nr:DUF5671 domain-containing protein [Anaerolineales bacterium]
MKTVRRLYFYAVAAISAEVVLWGVVNLLRSIFGSRRFVSGVGAGDLAAALALILVGIPIFAVHWLWAQKTSSREEEERSAGVRAVFLYGILLGTLIPVVQNLLALINRLFLNVAHLPTTRALFGGNQSWADNLIAVVVNLLIAAYFWNALRADWAQIAERESFIEARRLYRFGWLLCGLWMTLYGAQQALSYAFAFQTTTLGGAGNATAINALVFLLVGTPIWAYTWSVLQNALGDSDEKESYLRLGALYLLALGGVIVFLSASGTLLYQILNQTLGDRKSASDFLRGLGGSLSMAIPFGTLWAYYGKHLNLQFAFDENLPRRAGKRRLYIYVLSLLGLSATISGTLSLFAALIDFIFERYPLSGNLGAMLATPLSLLVIGLPVWLTNWNAAQIQARADDEVGDHARRSLIRKIYLYFVLFAAVIGVMASAGTLIFTLVNAALGGSASSILKSVLIELTALVVFAVALGYHLLALRADGSARADTLAEKQSAYRAAILDADGKFGEALKAAFAKRAPNIAPTVVNVNADFPADLQADAVILPGSLAVNTPENVEAWLRSFSGKKLIVSDEAAGVFWLDDFERAADLSKALAEGQNLRPQSSKRMNSLWTYVVYVAAALFACQFLAVLIGLGVTLLSGGF